MRLVQLMLLATFFGGALRTNQAMAWDSHTQARVRNFPSADVTLSDLSQGLRPGERLFTAGFVKDGIGGRSPNYMDDVANSSLLTCPPTFLENGDISACEISREINRAQWGWSEIRKSGELFRASEHTMIARASAERAGLMATTLFNVFWVRYATDNRYIASPLTLTSKGLTPPESRYLVGPSYLPTGGAVGSAHVARSVSLLELTQLPDASNSVADWAAGNELCPLRGYEGAYAGPENDGCHAFVNAMGAVNVTHFKPLNRAMWKHYHGLALRRMDQCKTLHELTSSFTVNWLSDYGTDEVKPFSNHYTEAHECVREAMVYEMFGQHFLQDAWSTGHMFNRWGHEELSEFDYGLEGEDRDLIPESNKPARRAAVAGMVAVTGGMVHGAKPKVQEFLRRYGLDDIAASRLVDDPLNGPVWYADAKGEEQHNIEWSSGDHRFRGAGDLFWWPEQSHVGTVYESPEFLEQRQRLINCGAKSMLEVYDRAPSVTVDGETKGLFGDPEPTEQSGAIESINLNDDYCWGQSATNASMRAALGFFSGAYTGTQRVADIASLMTGFIVDEVLGGVNFPPGDEGDHDDEPTKLRVRDRDRFNRQIGARLSLRMGQIREIYAANAERAPTGTESSRGCRSTADCPPSGTSISAAQAIDVLGVPPVQTPNLDLPLTQVPYVDQLLEPSADGPSPLQTAVARMFWRGNLDHTCRESIRDDSQLLNDLKAACIDGGDGAGDPDSCTECTYRAEALIPVCDYDTRPKVRNSKCSALGVVNNDAPPAGLPPVWFSNGDRWRPTSVPSEPTSNDLCAPPFYVAMAWCTGTPIMRMEVHERLSVESAPMEIDSSVVCKSAGFPDVTHRFGTRHFRRATIVSEPRAVDVIRDGNGRFVMDEYAEGPWLPFFVNAYHEAVTNEQGGDPCAGGQDIVSYSTDSVVQSNVGSADPAELWDFFFAGPRMPWCGHLQRMTQWQGAGADCISAAEKVHYNRRFVDVRFQDTGEYFHEWEDAADNKACFIVEPRRFVPACSDPSATCNAGWQCVAGQAPPALRRIGPSHFVQD